MTQEPFYENEQEMEQEHDDLLKEFDRKSPTMYRMAGDGEKVDINEESTNNGKQESTNNGKQESNNKQESNKNGKKKNDGPREYSVFKYSKRFRSSLHEAILLKDKPVFIRIGKKGDIETLYKITEDNRVIVPPNSGGVSL